VTRPCQEIAWNLCCWLLTLASMAAEREIRDDLVAISPIQLVSLLDPFVVSGEIAIYLAITGSLAWLVTWRFIEG
jgi:hypothetical protein